MWPQEMTMSSTPCVRSQSSMKAMNGRSTSGTTGLGTVEVSGRSRVPSPPARMSACMEASGAPELLEGAWPGDGGPADPFVVQPGGGDGSGVEQVAPVDDQRPAHAPGDLVEVHLGELGPLGDDHHRVRAVDGVERRGAELHSGEQAAGLLLGD